MLPAVAQAGHPCLTQQDLCTIFLYTMAQTPIYRCTVFAAAVPAQLPKSRVLLTALPAVRHHTSGT